MAVSRASHAGVIDRPQLIRDLDEPRHDAAPALDGVYRQATCASELTIRRPISSGRTVSRLKFTLVSWRARLMRNGQFSSPKKKLTIASDLPTSPAIGSNVQPHCLGSRRGHTTATPRTVSVAPLNAHEPPNWSSRPTGRCTCR